MKKLFCAMIVVACLAGDAWAAGSLINNLETIRAENEVETIASLISASIFDSYASGLMYLADQNSTVITMNVEDIRKYLLYSDLYHEENISFNIFPSDKKGVPKFALIYDLKNIDSKVKKALARKAKEHNFKDAKGKIFTEKANAIYFEGTTHRKSP